MENNSSKVMCVDALIIGGGFKGMMTAYGLRQKDLSVCIIDKSPVLGGFMSPMQWNGMDLDKGPQYLDGMNQDQKEILDDIMGDYVPLTELDFSYSSFWNGQTTQDFSIPDYRTLSKVERALILLETITQSTQEFVETIADEFSQQSETTSHYLDLWCKKFLQYDSRKLSLINKKFVTFFGRKLILDNELSLLLKQNSLFDDAIAANKKQINHNTYNLYPKGKTLGYFREAFEKKLEMMGVLSKLNTTVTSVTPQNIGYLVDLDHLNKIQVKDIYCAGTIESTEDLLLDSSHLSDYIRPVSQVFYLIELESEQSLPFYTMNYSDASLSRVTYFNDYALKNPNGKPVICVEVPTKMNHEIWVNPDAHFSQVCEELIEMGIGTSGFGEYKAVPIPSTYRALLKGYEAKLDEVKSSILQKYGASVHVLTPHLLTRSSVMDDLFQAGILNVES